MKTITTIRSTLSALILLITCALSIPINAQQTSPAATSQCTGSESPWRDFDFWIGNWEVYDPNTGNKVGDNRIEKRENGCLILENWKSIAGGSGISMNFYDPLEKKWRQVWQSAPAFIDYSGGLDEQGRMQLEGAIYYNASGQSAPFRGRWTAQDDGSVLQEFWQYDATSDNWNSWFVGEYRRSETKSE